MAARVSSLTESGILAAITVVMALVAMYVPVLGIVAVLLWPLPMIVLLVRHGLKWALMSVFVAMVLTAAMVEPIVAVRLVISFAPTGIALGLGYRQKWPGVRTFTVAVAASIVAKIMALALLFYLTGIAPFTGQLEAMGQQFQQATGMYEAMGMTAAQIEEARVNFEGNLKLISLLLPTMVLIMGVLDTALNFYVGGKILRRLGEAVPVFPSFPDWRLPKMFLIMFMFSLFGVYWGQVRDIQWLYQMSLNMNMVGTAAGFIQGLAIYEAAAEHYRWPRLMSTVVFIATVLIPFLTQMLVFIGLFDMYFDYRRRLGWRP